MAHREHQRARQADVADADLSCGAEGICPDADEVPITIECDVGARHAAAHEECRGPLEYKYAAYVLIPGEVARESGMMSPTNPI
jgi:hypothetical protein